MQLLRQAAVNPKDNVLDYLVRYFAPQMAISITPQGAAKLYDEAARLPHTRTRAALECSEGITLNGPVAAGASRSVLMYACEQGVPRVFKMPPGAHMAAREFAAWESASRQLGAECLVGPLKLITLPSSGDGREVRHGILMPAYVMSLQQVSMCIKRCHCSNIRAIGLLFARCPLTRTVGGDTVVPFFHSHYQQCFERACARLWV